MKKLATLTAAVALLAALAPAGAADMYTGSTKDTTGSIASNFRGWTGFYAGINGGYGWDSGTSFGDAIAASSIFAEHYYWSRAFRLVRLRWHRLYDQAIGSSSYSVSNPTSKVRISATIALLR